MIKKFVNAFAKQATRRAARAADIPRILMPAVHNAVREINRQIQWGNTKVWQQRWEFTKQLARTIQQQQTEVSPVYRHRGLSKTVRAHVGPNPEIAPPTRNNNRTTIVMSGLAAMALFSLVGPVVAKKVNWNDPLKTAEARLSDPVDIQLK